VALLAAQDRVNEVDHQISALEDEWVRLSELLG